MAEDRGVGGSGTEVLASFLGSDEELEALGIDPETAKLVKTMVLSDEEGVHIHLYQDKSQNRWAAKRTDKGLELVWTNAPSGD